MGEKVHQSNRSEYQIRIDGNAVRYYTILSHSVIDEYLDICNDNSDCYVDICRVNHEIIMNQGCYHAMKRHFDNTNKE